MLEYGGLSLFSTDIQHLTKHFDALQWPEEGYRVDSDGVSTIFHLNHVYAEQKTFSHTQKLFTVIVTPFPAKSHQYAWAEPKLRKNCR